MFPPEQTLLVHFSLKSAKKPPWVPERQKKHSAHLFIAGGGLAKGKAEKVRHFFSNPRAQQKRKSAPKPRKADKSWLAGDGDAHF